MNQIAGKRADGTPFLMLVLEPGNLERLQQGRPVFKRVEDFFPDGIPRRLELVIGFSETPIADARGLRDQAQVALDERTPESKKKRPHCPECKSTIEQLGVMQNESPIVLVFCPNCGCVLSSALADQMLKAVEA